MKWRGEVPPPIRERERAEVEQRECAFIALRHLRIYCLMRKQKKRASLKVRALLLKVRFRLSTIVEIVLFISIPVQYNANLRRMFYLANYLSNILLDDFI